MKTDYMVIDVSPMGEVNAMHREEILDLGFLGAQKIVRASEIKFDEESQRWDVWPVDEARSAYLRVAPGKGFASYDIARKFEVRWFEDCRMRGVNPISGVGCLIAWNLRPEFGLDNPYKK